MPSDSISPMQVTKAIGKTAMRDRAYNWHNVFDIGPNAAESSAQPNPSLTDRRGGSQPSSRVDSLRSKAKKRIKRPQDSYYNSSLRK